jgi:hypothetical protein
MDRVAIALAEADLEGRGERVHFQVAIGVAELDQLGAGAFEGVLRS